MKSLDQLRRDAKALRRVWEAGDTHARHRIANHRPRPEGAALAHADFLHVIARENAFESWPALKLAVELHGLDRAARQQRLRIALHFGQHHVVDRLLLETPDLAEGRLDLQLALVDRSAVAAALEHDPEAATRPIGARTPMCHLAFSRRVQARPDLAEDSVAIARLLVAHGASVDEAMPAGPDTEHRLSALYGAIGHADNMALGRWLLEEGADPNDNESLYHATELGHREGLRLLLAHGADPRGTNALLRAMDFHDHAAVAMLIAAGALADERDASPEGGDAPQVVPSLHQAARRMSDARMIALLLDAGADPARRFMGCTPYGFARVFGNRALADAIAARGGPCDLTEDEATLATAADGTAAAGRSVDPARLPEAYRDIVRTILHLPGKLDHVRRLVALGVAFDRPGPHDGVTPVQAAGWEGLPDVMAYLLDLGPDLTHQNDYGGTLLSTIVHGSENCPQRAERDHAACVRMALTAGVPLPSRAAEFAGVPEIAEILDDWAALHPGQIVEGGPV